MIKINVTVITGILLIMTGLVLNVWVMTGLFSPYAYESGTIESPTFKFIVIVFDVILILIGCLFIIFKKKSSVIKISKNIMVLYFTVLIILIIFELMFPFLLPFVPRNIQSFINSPYEIMCQSSKDKIVPDKYLAIMGDSYAQGGGDWLLETDFWKNEKFHAAHLINENLGIDVISFGHSGASSITGIVDKPLNNLRKIRHRFNLPDPSMIVVYFYEGNDITDNLRDLENRKPSYYDFAGLDSLENDIFKKYLNEKVISSSNYEYLRGKVIGISLMINLVYNAINKLRGKEFRGSYQLNEWIEDSEFNKALIGDSSVVLPQRLQGPACELSLDRIEQSLKIFDYSLAFLKSKMPDSKIFVVYLPSVLSCYEIEGDVSVQSKGNKAAVFHSDIVYRNSDSIFTAIEESCDSQNIAFIDARTPLRKTAKKIKIHGPKDWKHFNRLGYEVLAETISDYIKKGDNVIESDIQ